MRTTYSAMKRTSGTSSCIAAAGQGLLRSATDSVSITTLPARFFTWPVQRIVVALSNVQRVVYKIGSVAAFFHIIVRVASSHSPRVSWNARPDEEKTQSG